MNSNLDATYATLNSLNKSLADGSMTAEQHQFQVQGLLSTLQQPPAFDAQAMANFFAQQLALTTAPWRGPMATYQASFQAMADDVKGADLKSLQQEVFVKAKDAALSPFEVLALQYLLFYGGSPEEACRMLAAIILRCPGASRYQLHNFGAIAPNMDSGDLHLYGQYLEKLPFPLFPPLMCRSVNADIISCHHHLLVGGSGEPSVTLKSPREFFRLESDLVGGEAPAKGKRSLEEENRNLKEEVAMWKRKAKEAERKIRELEERKDQGKKPLFFANPRDRSVEKGFSRAWQANESNDGSVSSPKN